MFRALIFSTSKRATKYLPCRLFSRSSDPISRYSRSVAANRKASNRSRHAITVLGNSEAGLKLLPLSAWCPFSVQSAEFHVDFSRQIDNAFLMRAFQRFGNLPADLNRPDENTKPHVLAQPKWALWMLGNHRDVEATRGRRRSRHRRWRSARLWQSGCEPEFLRVLVSTNSRVLRVRYSNEYLGRAQRQAFWLTCPVSGQIRS